MNLNQVKIKRCGEILSTWFCTIEWYKKSDCSKEKRKRNSKKLKKVFFNKNIDKMIKMFDDDDDDDDDDANLF